jgi:hypothetical protein
MLVVLMIALAFVLGVASEKARVETIKELKRMKADKTTAVIAKATAPVQVLKSAPPVKKTQKAPAKKVTKKAVAKKTVAKKKTSTPKKK